MAVTRINNNQISDASTGNTYVGINAAVKLQNYSVTSAKLANNLTYASDLTVTGNLTIQGNTTTVDTTYTTIEDPTILLASNQTGSPAVDIGFVGERGTSNNIAFVWDESATEFVTVFTSSAESNTTISISSYANLHTNDSNVGGNLRVGGTTSLVGNVLGNININSNVNAANGYFTSNVTVLGTLAATSNIIANTSGIFYGNTVTGNAAIYAGVPGFTTLGSNVVVQVAGNVNSYSQINFENINTGSEASTDYIATADNGNDSTNFVDLGIGSSTYAPVAYPAFRANDAYLLNNGGNLLINSQTAGKIIKFIVGGSANTDVIATISNTTMSMTGAISATGNVTGGNLNTGAQVVATGNITGGNLRTAGQVSATANITGGNIITAGLGSFGTTLSAAGNITGGNITTAGAINTATLSTTGNAVIAGNLFVLGNITYNNVDDLRIEDPVIIMGTGPNGTPLTGPDSYDRGIYMEWYKTGLGNSWIGWQNSSGNLIAAANVLFSGNNIVTVNSYGTFQTGNIYAQSSLITGNITGGNLLTSGVVSAASHIGSVVSVSGNITGGNVNTAGIIVAATVNAAAIGNAGAAFTGASVSAATIGNTGAALTGATVSATANITGGNILTGGLISSTGNITGGNVNTTSLVGSVVSISGNITGANINTGGASGLILNGANINSNAARITINQIDADVDFAIDGDTVANVFYVDAGTGTVSIGSSTQTTNAALAINATNSFLMPVGNTAQRPGTGITGMLRFNSTLDAVEVYDADGWATVGTPAFTVISDQQFNGDGVTVAFTLAAAATTNSVIVSINGIVQIPTTAYSVSSTTLTFTEAPQTGDLIDVRNITTTTQVTSISNSPGNAVVAVSPTAAQVNITGDLSVNNIVNSGANGTGNIGNSTTYFNTVFAKATSAQYADLAENYVADAAYAPGTVLSFGGEKEVTLTELAGDRRIAGVVSTNPSYIMNSTVEGEFIATVALTGRVPTFVSGTIEKGDMMVAGGNGRAVACATPAVGTVIGKALENHAGGEGVIEVVVGRF